MSKLKDRLVMHINEFFFQDKDWLYNQIVKRIDEVRSHCVGVRVTMINNKALVQSILRDAWSFSKDVKELQESGIIFSTLGSDEGVASIFKEIDTYGMDTILVFQDVKMRVEEYCCSKAKDMERFLRFEDGYL
ncbi:hypothetical protein BUALT_Bualt12G0133900 [Buddleja alternifolia]|uniref:Uncharacterized protein n=1 Tax=Buddleja alternifolia TaxID=168488 RepID=A0AAV6WZ12_9LAMI|nr:hypothetical protein BUALT_Bualt12G0133900 [Buddleja alternifolia]